jgi:unsaturated chondroitin disaccharide hydrolase
MNTRKEMEPLKRKSLFASPPRVENDFWKNALAYCSGRIKNNIAVFKDRYPSPASVKGVYPLIGNTDWTSAFWPGLLFLAWENTGEELYRRAGESLVAGFRERLEKRIETETHDIGFLYTLSCVAPWRLFGSGEARETAIMAADLLLHRYHEKAGIIQAWGNLGDPGSGDASLLTAP